MNVLIEWLLYASAWELLFRRGVGDGSQKAAHAAIDIIQDYVDVV